MIGIGFQHRELLIGAGAYIRRQRTVIVPKVRVCEMDHLKRLCSSSLVVYCSAADTLVKFPCFQIGLKL